MDGRRRTRVELDLAKLPLVLAALERLQRELDCSLRQALRLALIEWEKAKK